MWQIKDFFRPKKNGVFSGKYLCDSKSKNPNLVTIGRLVMLAAGFLGDIIFMGINFTWELQSQPFIIHVKDGLVEPPHLKKYKSKMGFIFPKFQGDFLLISLHHHSYWLARMSNRRPNDAFAPPGRFWGSSLRPKTRVCHNHLKQP